MHDSVEDCVLPRHRVPGSAVAAASIPSSEGGSSANFHLKNKKVPAKIRSRRRRPWVMNDFLCPTMPCSAVCQDHRIKNPKSSFGIPALVARPVSKAEIARNPTLKTGSCLDALKKEWKRLRDRKVWDESTVISWSLIASMKFIWAKFLE
jgi:hypothetical protein